MFPALLEWTSRLRRHYPFDPGRVLEIGSRDVNGSPRELFADASEYIGIDQCPGPGVDRVLSGHDLGSVFEAGVFDSVLCFETLEHDPRFWKTLEQIRWVLRSGGWLIITTPTFRFPQHRYPIDCFRFGADAFRQTLFDGYDLVELAQETDSRGSPCLCGAGKKR